jgi:AbrB family looped-hinge helix DNA binding protein
MQQITRTVTSKGQVTIPKQIRERLGIDANDRVIFVVADSGTVELHTAPYRMRDLRGILPAIPGRETEDFDDFIDEAMQTRSDQLATGNLE